MKTNATALLFAALLGAGCSGSPGTDGRAMPAGESAGTQPAIDGSPDAVPAIAQAEGTVDAVDAAAGTITITHGPVDALGWPAMTMPFGATPEQAASVKAGDRIEFEFDSRTYALTRISPGQ